MMNLLLFMCGLLVAMECANEDPVYDIQFEAPDLQVSFTVDTGSHRRSTKPCPLEGFKIRSGGTSNSMMWASLGCPTLLKFNGEKIFSFGPEDVTTHIRLLTNEQKEALMQEAKRKHKITDEGIAIESFKPMPLQQFTCSIEFMVEGKSYKMSGDVFDLKANPLTLSFPYWDGSAEQQMLKTRLNGNHPISLKCKVASIGKSERMNTLTITGSEDAYQQVWSNVFGTGEVAMLTRSQMQRIGGEIVTSLDIEENYELEGEDFSEKFIQQLIDTAIAKFKETPIDEALKQVSKYGFDSKDMSPDVIKKQLSHVLKIDKTNSTQHLITNKEYDNSGSLDSNMSGDASASVVGIGSASAKYAAAYKQDWKDHGKSVDDQLKAINSDRQSDVKWERDGDQIIPKSLNVAVVQKASLKKQLNFNRVKKRVKNASYTRSLDLNARNAMSNWRVQEVIKSERVTNWGDWGHWEYCPPNHYANGFQMKTESHQGGGLPHMNDDTAVNAVKLFCVSTPPTNMKVGEITSTEGPWGEWGKVHSCNEGEFLKGFRSKSMENQGSGDDWGLINMLMICSDGKELKGDGHDQWAQWSQDVRCPLGYICGIQTQVEPNQGSGDDSAMNNVNFKCCDDIDDSKVNQ